MRSTQKQKVMKRLLIASVVLAGCFTASAQQMPIYNNVKLNYFMLNPAAAGNMGHWAMRAQFRGEWVRFPGAPVSESFSMSGLLGESKKVGLGFALFNDIIGPEGRYGILGGYSYHLPIGESTLGLGLGTRFYRYKLDLANVNVLNETDMTNGVLNVNEGFLFDFGAGAYFYGNKFYAGLSAPVIAQAVGSDVTKAVMHYLLFLGYKWAAINTGSQLHIEPSVLLKGSAGGLMQLDGNLKFHLLREQLFFGAGIRVLGSGKDAVPASATYVSASVGTKLLDRYHFAYSYDFGIGEGTIQPYTWGSHEVLLGWDFDWKTKSRYASAE
jgi:type IX secretion system PorP/SprF family membrane protein